MTDLPNMQPRAPLKAGLQASVECLNQPQALHSARVSLEHPFYQHDSPASCRWLCWKSSPRVCRLSLLGSCYLQYRTACPSHCCRHGCHRSAASGRVQPARCTDRQYLGRRCPCGGGLAVPPHARCHRAGQVFQVGDIRLMKLPCCVACHCFGKKAGRLRSVFTAACAVATARIMLARSSSRHLVCAFL